MLNKRSNMKSQFNLKYVKVDKNNFSIAYELQSQIWPEDPDYEGLYDRAIHPSPENCSFLVYDKEKLIGITGTDFYSEYPDTIWMDWFAVLPEYRCQGYGKKILLDTINFCKNLNKYNYFRLDTTKYESIPALHLYDKIMHYKEEYTKEDTEERKNEFLIYTYSFTDHLEPWNNRHLGLRKYYDQCDDKEK